MSQREEAFQLLTNDFDRLQNIVNSKSKDVKFVYEYEYSINLKKFNFFKNRSYKILS